jgi:hypothetical protein
MRCKRLQASHGLQRKQQLLAFTTLVVDHEYVLELTAMEHSQVSLRKNRDCHGMPTYKISFESHKSDNPPIDLLRTGTFT